MGNAITHLCPCRYTSRSLSLSLPIRHTPFPHLRENAINYYTRAYANDTQLGSSPLSARVSIGRRKKIHAKPRFRASDTGGGGEGRRKIRTGKGWRGKTVSLSVAEAKRGPASTTLPLYFVYDRSRRAAKKRPKRNRIVAALRFPPLKGRTNGFEERECKWSSTEAACTRVTPLRRRSIRSHNTFTTA